MNDGDRAVVEARIQAIAYITLRGYSPYLDNAGDVCFAGPPVGRSHDRSLLIWRNLAGGYSGNWSNIPRAFLSHEYHPMSWDKVETMVLYIAVSQLEGE